MKIPLININGGVSEEQYGAVILLKSLRLNSIPEQFVIDTGSPKTVIPYDKALRLQLPLNKKYEKVVCRGGHKYTAYEVNIKFVLFSDKNETIEEPFSCLVLKPTSQKMEKELGYFPVILGIDFLRKRGYNLIMDFKKEEFYLEK